MTLSSQFNAQGLAKTPETPDGATQEIDARQ